MHITPSAQQQWEHYSRMIAAAAPAWQLPGEAQAAESQPAGQSRGATASAAEADHAAVQAGSRERWSSTIRSELRMSSEPHSTGEAECAMLDRDLVYDTVGCICVDQQGELLNGSAF